MTVSSSAVGSAMHTTQPSMARLPRQGSFLAAPEEEFIGCVELATAVHAWTPSEASAYPGDSAGGVLLARVSEWDLTVPMASVVQRIDPTGSNPIVQENAALGFRMGVVLITAEEYENALALSREAPAS